MAGYTSALLAWAVIVFAFIGSTGANIAVFLVVSPLMTAVLVVVAMKKTEGTWAWQRKLPSGTE